MYTCAVRPEIAALSAYVPGMSIAEIQEKYGLSKVVKMASNENPLGVSPLVKEALGLHAGTAFRYPQGGNPRPWPARTASAPIRWWWATARTRSSTC